MLKVLGLTLYGPLAASTRYRLLQYAPGLRDHDIELDIKPLLGDSYIRRKFAGEPYNLVEMITDYSGRLLDLSRQGRYDAAILYAELFPLLPGTIEASMLRIPYVFDLDDNFFLKYSRGRFGKVSFLLRDKFRPIVSKAAAVTAGNRYLADRASLWNSNVHLLPTVVDTDRYMCAPKRREDAFTIGWVGSPSTSSYLKELIAPLSRLGQEGQVRFVVVGGQCPAIENVEVINKLWQEETEVDVINTFDVGVMPLSDDEWTRGKCAFKLIQYMACGVPVIASPVGANLDVVSSECGLLAGSSESWLEAFRRLRDAPDLRVSLGLAGRKRIEERYSLDTALPLMAGAIREAAETRLPA